MRLPTATTLLSLLLSLLPSPTTAQGVTSLIVPSSTPPSGCDNSRSGTFTITIVNASVPNSNNPTTSVAQPSRRSYDLLHLASHPLSPRDLALLPRQNSGVLTLTLVAGILTDQAGRTGYIASNYQFQFDKPPQAGAIYTGGFGMCANGSLSLGGSAIFWQCLSGTFYNLYDRDWAQHCIPVYFEAIGGAGNLFEQSPSVPVSTGGDQNTISNGGGTQGGSVTTGGVGIGVGTGTGGVVVSTSKGAGITGGSASGSGSGGGSTGSVTATRTGTGGGAGSATTGSGVSSTAGAASGSGSGSGGASSSSSAALAAVGTEVPIARRVVAWAVGIVGAVAVI